jgi:hypothetical protein
MTAKPEGSDQELKIIQLLLAGLLLKDEPRPELGKLAKLIHVRKETLSDLLPEREAPRRANRRKRNLETQTAAGGETL